MPTKRHSAEQIVRKLREAEVELAQGGTVKDACRKLAITEHTYYRWRREYGGLKVNQARRLKQLEKENTRLKKLVAEKELDLSILKEVAEGTSEPSSTARGGGACTGAAGRLREAGVPGTETTTHDTEVHANRTGR